MAGGGIQMCMQIFVIKIEGCQNTSKAIHSFLEGKVPNRFYTLVFYYYTRAEHSARYTVRI